MTHPQQRSFNCHACNGIIYIPYQLPPTTAPCPHCGVPLTSPPIPSAPSTIEHTALPSASTSEPDHVQKVVEQPSHVTPMADDIASRQVDSSSGKAAKASSRISVPVIMVAVISVIVIGSCATLLVREYLYQKKYSNTIQVPAIPSNVKSEEDTMDEYYRKGWIADAEVVLKAFLEAKSPQEKAKYVIGGLDTLERLRVLYGDKLFYHDDITVESFYPVAVPEESIKSNVFLMTYHRPEQLEMAKFFRPLITSEMLHGLEQVSPLVESLGNMNNYKMPRLTVQAFFKKTDQGMLIDWDVFAQTRFQALKKFFREGKVGQQKEFRVILYKFPYSSSKQDANNSMTIGVCDPAHIEDSFSLIVKRDASIDDELKKLDSAPGEAYKAKYETATVLLEHAGEDQMYLKKLINWEFKGLGSQSLNAEKNDDSGKGE